MDLFLHPDSHSFLMVTISPTWNLVRLVTQFDFIIWQLVEKILSLLLDSALKYFSSVIERIQVVKRLWTENFGLWVCHCFLWWLLLSLSWVHSLNTSCSSCYFLTMAIQFLKAFSSVIFHPRPYTVISSYFHVFQGLGLKLLNLSLPNQVR